MKSLFGCPLDIIDEINIRYSNESDKVFHPVSNGNSLTSGTGTHQYTWTFPSKYKEYPDC